MLAITVALGFAARDIKSEFSIRDILPRGGAILTDLNTLDAAVGGSTEITSVLIRAEATDTRTLLDMQGLRLAFQNELRRPHAAAGPIQTSYEMLIQDWITDSGEPGDKYDPEIAALFRTATAGVQIDPVLMQEILDRIGAMDPVLARDLVNDPNGMDTILIQFPAYTGDPGATRLLQQDIEELWTGDDDAITATSDSIISFTVTDSVRDRQTDSIVATIAVALAVLALFFWLTLRQPALALIAVAPHGPGPHLGAGHHGSWSVSPTPTVTSIITALSIGIGVDYTIHMIHRYREEFDQLAQPGAGCRPDALDHRFGAAGLCHDNRALGYRRARRFPIGRFPAVRHHRGDNNRVFARSSPYC